MEQADAEGVAAKHDDAAAGLLLELGDAGGDIGVDDGNVLPTGLEGRIAGDDDFEGVVHVAGDFRLKFVSLRGCPEGHHVVGFAPQEDGFYGGGRIAGKGGEVVGEAGNIPAGGFVKAIETDVGKHGKLTH